MNTYRFMCADLYQAKRNREMVAQKLYIWAYLQVEAWLADNPVNDLPQWLYSEGFVQEREKSRKSRGTQRANKLTPERRREIARSAANKRWHR